MRHTTKTVLLYLALLALFTSGVVAPIPGLSSLSSLFGEDESTPDPDPDDVGVEKEAGASASGAGSLAFDKKVHLGNPKIASLDTNFDLAASKSAGVSKGFKIEKGKEEEPEFPLPDLPIAPASRVYNPAPGPQVVYIRPPSGPPPYRIVEQIPPRPLPPPPHFNVHHANNRPPNY